MKTNRVVLAALVLVIGASPSFADSEAWRSFPNGFMHQEIVCPAGLQKMVSATTNLELFAGSWEPQPTAQSKSELQWPSFRGHIDLHNMTRESGNVLVELLIGKQGQVVAGKVVCSNNPRLDAMALRLTENARYRPAKIAGVPILSVIKRPINFGG